jgi:hypothetical protein
MIHIKIYYLNHKIKSEETMCRYLKRIPVIIFLMVLIWLQAGSQDISAVNAMRLFDKKDYGRAEEIFRLLLEEDNDNTLLNYYYGACRTENGHFSDEDLNYLLKAGKQVTPQRIHYYMGVQYHARNEWEQALKFYNQFRISAPEEEQKELKLTELIQQCYDRVNPFKGDINKDDSGIAETHSERIIKNIGDVTEVEGLTEEKGHEKLPEAKRDLNPELEDKPENKQDYEEIIPDYEINEPGISVDPLDENAEIQSPSKENIPGIKKPDNITIQRRALPDLPGVKPTVDIPEEEPVEFQINNQITYLYPSHFKTEEGKKLFDRLKSLQKQLDNSLKQADRLREQYLKTNDRDKKADIGEKILALENISYKLKEEINKVSDECRETENKYWQGVSSAGRENFILELEKIKAAREAQFKQEEFEEPEVTHVIITQDNLLTATELRHERTTSQKSADLVYKIQIGAYSRGLPSYIQRLYNKLSLIRKIEHYTDEKGVEVYTTGNLTTYDDAVKMQNQLKQEGVKNPQVAPYFNGKRITLERAKEIESGK